ARALPKASDAEDKPGAERSLPDQSTTTRPEQDTPPHRRERKAQMRNRRRRNRSNCAAGDAVNWYLRARPVDQKKTKTPQAGPQSPKGQCRERRSNHAVRRSRQLVSEPWPKTKDCDSVVNEI